MSNLDLWNSVEKTDPKYTKKVNQRGGYTNIDAYYLFKKATERLGPYGKGFGLCESKINTSMIESTGIALHEAVFFYVIDGETVKFPINNAIQANNGKWFDVDFAKKVETNTVSKALSKIGFSADVYIGKFEDQGYLYELSNEMAIQNAADKDEEQAKQAKKAYEETNKVIEQIKEATTLSIVEGLFKAQFRRIQSKDQNLVLQLTKAKDAAKERLTND